MKAKKDLKQAAQSKAKVKIQDLKAGKKASAVKGGKPNEGLSGANHNESFVCDDAS